MTDERYAYIGRPITITHYGSLRSIFGNPFRMRDEEDRERVIALYEKWFLRKVERNSTFGYAVRLLQGKILVCWCAPLPCHGDVIAAWLDSPDAG
jgi:hypothetical protein